MDSLVMVADVMADLKEKSDGELADRCGPYVGTFTTGIPFSAA